jgi:hypothetical protein
MRRIVTIFRLQTGASFFNNTTYDFSPSFTMPRPTIPCVTLPTSHSVPRFIHLLPHTSAPSRHSPPPITIILYHHFQLPLPLTTDITLFPMIFRLRHLGARTLRSLPRSFNYVLPSIRTPQTYQTSLPVVPQIINT